MAPVSPVRLPIVDLAEGEEAVVSALYAACSRTGGFYVVNHGIDVALLDAVLFQSAAFFSQPAEAKAVLAAAPEGAPPGAPKSGWHAPGTMGVDRSAAAADSREVLRFALTDVDLGRHPAGKAAPLAELMAGPPAEGLRLWPDACHLPGFQPAVLAYFEAANRLAERLIRLAACALGLKENALLADDAVQAEAAWATLMLLHYPACATDAARGKYACGAHKDRFTQFTILAAAPSSSGLEAQAADGYWHEVPPLPGALIVNVGSLLEIWSNGVFRALVHRVVNPAGRQRFSAAFFRGCAPGTVVRPLVAAPTGGAGGFAPVRFGDYLAGFSTAFKRTPAAPAAVAAGKAAAIDAVAEDTMAAPEP